MKEMSPVLQEIAPKEFYNPYEHRELQMDSRVVCVCGGMYCIIHEAGGDRFPSFREVAAQLAVEVLQYAFAITEGDTRRDYFLAALSQRLEFLGLPAHTWEPTSYINHKMGPRHEAFAGMCAHHLYMWYRDNRFCGRCGGAMIHDEKERMMRCPGCGNMVFPRIAPAVVVAVRHNGKLLLTKYAHGDGNYALVAGFVEFGETAEQCAAREVMEETGLRIKHVRYYDSQPWGFAGNLMLAYTAELDGDDTIHTDLSELSVAEWVAPQELSETYDYSSLTREMIRRFREGRL